MWTIIDAISNVFKNFPKWEFTINQVLTKQDEFVITIYGKKR